jgi:hypothetical protein
MAGWINTAQQRRDHKGQRDVCATCGQDATGRDPLVNATDGYRVHRSHTTDPRNGYYRQAQGG